MPAVNELIHAPEFQVGTWLNTPPLSIAALRGSALLVEFWDYTCINCLRTLPYMREWWQRYRPFGLTLVGVHTPEFAFAQNLDNVKHAVENNALAYPILMDNDYRNWRAWMNRYWPSRYLVDKEGYISYFHYGEGDYVGAEWFIQLLLKQVHPTATFPPPMPPLRLADEPGAVCFRATPKLYLGYQRGKIGNPEPLHADRTAQYSPVEECRLNTAYLEGYWYSGPEAVRLAMPEGSVLVSYAAKEVYLIASPPEGTTGVIELLQDGEPPAGAAGSDVSVAEQAMVLNIDMPRMYSVIDNPHYGEHTLHLRVRTPGTSLFAFSFITECIDEEVRGEQAA